METPEAPREANATRLGKSAEAFGLEAARWAGRGDQARGLSLLALAAAAGAYVCLFMPWLGQNGHTVSGWNFELPRAYGLLVLAVVLVELLALARAWISSGAELIVFCLVAAAGVVGVSAVADLRWGGINDLGFSVLAYGAWLGLVFSILLILLAALLLARLWRPRP